jgi:hypothetical protein
MNGDDASNTFTDSSSNNYAVTAVGTAQIDTAQSKFGGSSGLFDGDSDWLTVVDNTDWCFSNGDFVIDFWLRYSGTNSFMGVCGQKTSAPNSMWRFYLDSVSKWTFNSRDNGTSTGFFIQTSAWSYSLNTWYHVAFVRSGASAYLFINGQSQALTQNNAWGTLADIGSSLFIGQDADGDIHKGWIEEFRISKGTDRGWTTDFSVPAAEYSSAAAGGFLTTNSKFWGA